MGVKWICSSHPKLWSKVQECGAQWAAVPVSTFSCQIAALDGLG